MTTMREAVASIVRVRERLAMAMLTAETPEALADELLLYAAQLKLTARQLQQGHAEAQRG